MNNKSVWTKETIGFAEQSETRCDTNFLFLTENIEYFQTITKNPTNSQIDYQFTTTKGCNGVAELKNRSISITDYDSIMIETGKYNKLKEYADNGFKSLYINFMNNTKNKVWICNINKIKNVELELKNVPIRNKFLSSSTWYKGDRFYIPTLLGHYYEFNTELNKYIKIY